MLAMRHATRFLNADLMFNISPTFWAGLVEEPLGEIKTATTSLYPITTPLEAASVTSAELTSGELRNILISVVMEGETVNIGSGTLVDIQLRSPLVTTSVDPDIINITGLLDDGTLRDVLVIAPNEPESAGTTATLVGGVLKDVLIQYNISDIETINTAASLSNGALYVP